MTRLVLLLLCVTILRAEDWAQHLGPRRDGTYHGAPLAKTWPKEGPKTLWTAPVGQGWSAPVVVSNKVVLFHRQQNFDIIQGFDAATGASVWTNSYPSTYRDSMGFESGPRATLTISNGRIFTYGADGQISATDLAGKTLWRVDAKKEFGSDQGFFGRASSPLVANDLLLLNVGGREGSGVIALETATGKLRWKTSNDEASYSSPTFLDTNTVLFLTRNELVALISTNGARVFTYTHKPRISASVTAATPLVSSNLLFITASYGAGAAALRVENNRPAQLWANDSTLSAHYATPVHREALLYGFHGRQEEGADFVCVEWATGKTRWRKERLGAGTVTLAGDHLFILLETGELVLARATPEKYDEVARAQILGSDVRAYPALADGFLFARDKTKLIKVDLR